MGAKGAIVLKRLLVGSDVTDIAKFKMAELFIQQIMWAYCALTFVLIGAILG